MSTRTKKIYRIIALYLAFNLLAEYFFPVAALALTNGPGQPEFQSFEPAGTTEMVNLFTGDFNYNIPLMTVPGPNGGYPINMAYHAGIGMEQEASWVGLGWNINAGAINRAMRGLPDDFNGEKIKKELHFKPNRTLSVNLGRSVIDDHTNKEFMGFKSIPYSINMGVNMYYNNYSGLGFGYTYGVSMANIFGKDYSNSKSKPLSINLSKSSDGIGVNVDYSFTRYTEGREGEHLMGWFGKAGLSWGSREGLTNFYIGGGYGVNNSTGQEPHKMSGFPIGAGLSFTKSAYIPSSTVEMGGLITMLGISIGTDSIGNFKAKKLTSINGSFAESHVKYESQDQGSIGYLYSHFSNSNSGFYKLQDINREKDTPPVRQTKNLGIPVATYDVFSVSGQGVGGAFRPYRSDVGIYTEPKVLSNINGGKLDAEFGMPLSNDLHWGANYSFSESNSYSGIWDNQWWTNGSNHGWDGVDGFRFLSLDGDGGLGGNHLYEPFYFKMSGEQTSSSSHQLDFVGGTQAVRLDLHVKYETDNTDIAVRPEIPYPYLYTDNSIGESELELTLSNNHRSAREKRIVSNQYNTCEELQHISSTASIYSTLNSFPATGGTGTFSAPVFSNQNPNLIGRFTEVNPDGNRYEYGIPVLNKMTKDVYFAKHGLVEYDTTYLHSFDPPEASLENNEEETDQYFSATTTPGYATEYLLTGIYSPDYVDVTNDGPTDDDLGYFVKFNYVKVHDNFKWRAPYYDAIVNAGYLSNKNDDKLSYSYGTKEVYYLHSIESKTHVACFVLNDTNRLDGHEALGEVANDHSPNHILVAGAAALKRLDHISLYSKADPNFGTSNATPLKTVHFTYDYSLCQGTLNNENNHYADRGESGKLTLKSVYFTYLKNDKGKLSPYQFDYVDASYDEDLRNPVYDPLGNDRWGTYKKQNRTSTDYQVRNNESPYVDQKTANRSRVDQSAAAWCLKKITLPSGSTIDVNYEADDYAFVQSKGAMQMCKVVGTCKEGENGVADISDKIGRTHKRICFELNTPIDHALSEADKKFKVWQYLAGIDQMYFKMYMRVKNQHYSATNDAFDYVDGYCKIVLDDNTSYGVINDGANNHLYGFFTVQLVDRDDYPGSNNPVNANPIQKAGWQYLYLERPDLFQSYDFTTASLTNLTSATVGMLDEIPRALVPYATADARLWCNRINLNTDEGHEEKYRPSYVRLNNPNGIKVGGGHRVKSIVMSDKWSELSGYAGQESKYGISYTYRLKDGRSSGVAAYEPMIGGEEIALRQPIRYDSDNLVKKDAAFYIEEPLGESYFPAPVVGYSRVVVKSIVGNNNYDTPLTTGGTPEEITQARSGQTVYEFYTAKDYPVQLDQTNLQKTWFPIPIWLPFIGAITYNNRGFSQGYSVILNDMHGKLKRVATYPYSANLNDDPIPVRSVFYRYNGVYDESGQRPSILSSTVNVLKGDGDYSEANLGETYDFFIDMRQHSNETKEYGGQFNTNTNTINGFTLPIFLPTINISRSLYRSAVTMKVIYRTGILTEVETIDDGATSKAKNLLFDGETGSPLLTSVTNEFSKPVYTYNYAAHWDYEGMRGAYNNIGVRFNGTGTNPSGQLTGVPNAGKTFFPGDEVLYMPSSGTGEILWVSSVNDGSGTVTLIKEDGSLAVSMAGDFVIVRSGYRNQQAAGNGTIVSLSDPTQNRKFPLFNALNALSDLSEETVYSFEDCLTGELVYFKLDVVANELHIDQCTSGGSLLECRPSIIFPSSFILISVDQLDGCDFSKAGKKISVVFPDASVVTGTWSDPHHCFNECLDDVLHAAAVRFVDNWGMNFADVDINSITANDYRTAEKGVWRTESNYLYQVDRKQSADAGSLTNISKDGTYDHFVLYSWDASPEENPEWSYVSQISRYSPYGYALESRDALGIYSSTMYGYDNTKQTAAASNCQYFELGFDAFEDYGSAAYSLTNAHGHLFFDQVGSGTLPTINSTYAHTGLKSLAVAYGNEARHTTSPITGTYSNTQKYFTPQPNTKYNLTVWARADNGGTPAVQVVIGTNIYTYTTDPAESAIEGWKRIEVNFTAPASGTMTISLICQDAGTAYFDDFRIQPFSSGMVSYVYDPQTHWLLAELDNRNFATFYNYDEEGAVIQVKQETEKGVFTVKTARSNIKR